MATGYQWDSESARRAQEKSVESRRRRQGMTPSQRAVDDAERAVPLLMEQLLDAALGRDAWAELSPDLRLRALFRALEYGAGKPVTGQTESTEEQAPDAADLFAGEAPSPMEGNEMPGRTRELEAALAAERAEKAKVAPYDAELAAEQTEEEAFNAAEEAADKKTEAEDTAAEKSEEEEPAAAGDDLFDEGGEA